MKARLGDSDQDGALQLGGVSVISLGPRLSGMPSSAGGVLTRTRDRFRRVSATTATPGAGGGTGGGAGGGGGSRPRGPTSAY